MSRHDFQWAARSCCVICYIHMYPPPKIQPSHKKLWNSYSVKKCLGSVSTSRRLSPKINEFLHFLLFKIIKFSATSLLGLRVRSRTILELIPSHSSYHPIALPSQISHYTRTCTVSGSAPSPQWVMEWSNSMELQNSL